MGADELIRLLVDVKPSLEGQVIEDTLTITNPFAKDAPSPPTQ